MKPGGLAVGDVDKAMTVSVAAIALGAALLVVVPLGGALLLTAGSLGLVISSETPVGGPGNAASGDNSEVSDFRERGTFGPTRSAVM